jgi:hypothetical protein
MSINDATMPASGYANQFAEEGMVDAAGVHGETDQRKLAGRVRRAVFGYLNTLV